MGAMLDPAVAGYEGTLAVAGHTVASAAFEETPPAAVALGTALASALRPHVGGSTAAVDSMKRSCWVPVVQAI